MQIISKPHDVYTSYKHRPKDKLLVGNKYNVHISKDTTLGKSTCFVANSKIPISVEGSRIIKSTIGTSTIANSKIYNSSIYLMDILNSQIKNTTIENRSVKRLVTNSIVDNSYLIEGTVYKSKLEDCNVFCSVIENCNLKDVIVEKVEMRNFMGSCALHKSTISFPGVRYIILEAHESKIVDNYKIIKCKVYIRSHVDDYFIVIPKNKPRTYSCYNLNLTGRNITSDKIITKELRERFSFLNLTKMFKS